LVVVAVSHWYHCLVRCGRRAFLFSEGEDSNSGDRKGWIERRLKELAEIFAVSVGGFSVDLFNTRAFRVAELVYEMPERTTFEDGQQG
jgi:hypothetical protein